MKKNNFGSTEESTKNVFEGRIRKLANVLQLGEPKPTKNNLQMLCPFHYENNPSFGINTETGEYHCFACDVKGHISKIAENLRSNIIAEKVDNINEFEISVKIDTIPFSTKPSGNKIGAIRNRLVNISLSKYTIKELLDLITTGHTVSLSGAKTNTEWQGQQVIMVDLDNEYQGVTMSDIVSYAKSIRLEPTFAYHTYSSTNDICRCRLGYVLKEPISDKQLYQAICNNLIKKFENYCADTSCNDFCRLYFGTINNDTFTSNIVYSTRFTVEQLNAIDVKNRSSNKEVAKNEAMLIGIENEFFIRNKFQHHIFGQYMISKYHIIRLNGNQLHFYKNGIYENNSNNHDIETEVSTIIPSLTNKQIEEVMGFLNRMAPKEIEAPYNYIAFENGILNIVTMNFTGFSPDIIITCRVHTEYVPYNTNMSNFFMDKFFKDITCRKQKNGTTIA